MSSSLYADLLGHKVYFEGKNIWNMPWANTRELCVCESADTTVSDWAGINKIGHVVGNTTKSKLRPVCDENRTRGYKSAH